MYCGMAWHGMAWYGMVGVSTARDHHQTSNQIRTPTMQYRFRCRPFCARDRLQVRPCHGDVQASVEAIYLYTRIANGMHSQLLPARCCLVSWSAFVCSLRRGVHLAPHGNTALLFAISHFLHAYCRRADEK